MSLSCGIVGLPNAGKSTLFNALASQRLSETAVHPFTTIDPHEAVVSVPDRDLTELSKVINPEKTIPATVIFIDIAGLIKGAHQGEGLGNQFLAKIREVDLIAHVVRAFQDPSVVHLSSKHEPGTLEQIIDDIEIVNLELELAGITGKKTVYILNVTEGQVGENRFKEITGKVKDKFNSEIIMLSAKLEEELIDFSPDERSAYLSELKIKETGLSKLIKKAYFMLDLITFYTVKGGKEVHAWSLPNGQTGLAAAGKVHTDFAQNFIKAEVLPVNDLLELGGWKKAKEKGKVRLEGKDYPVRNKDVIEFKVGK